MQVRNLLSSFGYFFMTITSENATFYKNLVFISLENLFIALNFVHCAAAIITIVKKSTHFEYHSQEIGRNFL